ncbi:MAG TPA: hypothetical protein PK868_01215 [Phycicoccus sp.]|nr:hypothetical protein [Phycicoccus sp.]HQY96966.1 hypothetical protein [Phycicoccus sp.]HRA44956.1 hypothetical protein [Phycicoccus sp.]
MTSMGVADGDVRAAGLRREPILWAVALVATGDPARARDAVVATLASWLSMGSDPDAQPGRLTREDLVARLLDGVPESAEGLAPEAAVEGEDKDEDEAVTGAVERALAGLTTRERLAVALVEFDDLPSRAADDLVGSAHASGWALAAIDKELAWLPWPVNGGEALRRWVEHESTDLVDGDLLQAAEARLARGRRRSRLIGAGVLAAVAAAVGLVATLQDSGPPTNDPAAASTSSPVTEPGLAPAPGSDPGPTINTRPRRGLTRIDGVQVDFAPAPVDEASLPFLVGAEMGLAIPRSMGFTPSDEFMTLSAAGPMPESVRAVFLRHIDRTHYAPVLYIPGHDPAYIQVDTITLDYPSEPSVGEPPRLSPRTIADDRHRLAFVQAESVVFLDVRSGEVTRLPVQDNAVRTGGWASGSTWFVASSPTTTWRLNPETREVSAVEDPVASGRRAFRTVEGQLTLMDLDYLGRAVAERHLPGPVSGVRGGTVDNIEGWAATGVTFTSASLLRGGSEGLYAVAVDLSPVASILVAANNRETDRQCCVALGWAEQDQVLYRTLTLGQDRIMVWDTATHEVRRVSELLTPVAVPGGWSGDFALSP